MEVIQQSLDDAKQHMDRTYAHLQEAFAKVHAGRAVPTMLQQVVVQCYGNPTPLQQLAAVHTMDARTLAVQPWDHTIIPAIEKAIAESQLGLATKHDGQVVMVTVPLPSEQRRRDLVKVVKNEAEKVRVSVRGIRRDYKESLKKMQKNGVSESDIKRAEKQLQELTDRYIDKIDALLALKETDIMSL